MNKNINLCKILEGHEGETFYCSLLGKNITLKSIRNLYLKFDDCSTARDDIEVFDNGAYYLNGECIIFPSKDQRDWDKWVEEQKPKTPKTWSEYLTQFGIDSEPTLWFDANMNWSKIGNSCSALFKIHELIEVGYGGNVDYSYFSELGKPDPVIIVPQGTIPSGNMGFYVKTEEVYDNSFSHIAFHTKEQAEEFLSYPENIQLLKDYFMV